MSDKKTENTVEVIQPKDFQPEQHKTILGLTKRNPAGRPPANIAGYLERIAPLLMEGMKITTACKKVGVPTSTVLDWYKRSAEFKTEVDRLQNYMSIASTSIIQNAMYGKPSEEMNLQEKETALKVAIWHKTEEKKEEARIAALNKGVDRASKDVLTEEEKEKTDAMIALLFDND